MTSYKPLTPSDAKKREVAPLIKALKKRDAYTLANILENPYLIGWVAISGVSLLALCFLNMILDWQTANSLTVWFIGAIFGVTLLAVVANSSSLKKAHIQISDIKQKNSNLFAEETEHLTQWLNSMGLKADQGKLEEIAAGVTYDTGRSSWYMSLKNDAGVEVPQLLVRNGDHWVLRPYVYR